MANLEWVLYVKAGCPWCVEAVAYFDKHGFPYRKVDVLRDPAAYQQMQKLSGQRLTPTLTVGDLVLPDFDTVQLEKFLQKHGLKPA